MKSFTFFMHNIYALGGTVKAVSELANTLADKGHHIEIISVFRAQDEPYFKINDNIKIPTVAIGGLNYDNIDILKGSKAKGVSVVRAIMDSKDPYEDTKNLKEKIVDILELK